MGVSLPSETQPVRELHWLLDLLSGKGQQRSLGAASSSWLTWLLPLGKSLVNSQPRLRLFLSHCLPLPPFVFLSPLGLSVPDPGGTRPCFWLFRLVSLEEDT